MIMCRQIRVGSGVMFATDIVGRRACSCVVLFYILYLRLLIFNFNKGFGGEGKEMR